MPQPTTPQQQKYHDLYNSSLENPAQFWGEQAERTLTWFKKWDEVLSGDFTHANVSWFNGGVLNACYNCLDRHLATKANQIAFIWEGDEVSLQRRMTYSELFDEVCRLARALKNLKVQKGDRVCIYMPMVPEAIVAMLACARIGAVHSVVFAGFSATALRDRIQAAECKLVITANEGVRGGKVTPLKKSVDQAVLDCPSVQQVLVLKRTEGSVDWQQGRDVWYHEAISGPPAELPCEAMQATDPLFILYTSGSTGKPKGIVHAVGGYLLYAAMTFKMVFDYQPDDIFWCTADVGWITGHSYVVYGPLASGATSLIYEGIPSYPTPARYWEIIDRHQVSIFYTSPTAIRALRREGEEWVKSTERRSLRVLGSVGEPINPEVWRWYHDIVGEGRCSIVDTWWQTETGGALISPLANQTPVKAGSASWPFLGIKPVILDDDGEPLPVGQSGRLAIATPWPGLMYSIYQDPDRYKQYFQEIKGYYLTGDNAIQDEDGFFWIIGRNDDVIKISGHRIGTGEVESAFLQHVSVAEVGVVAIPHPIKGETIYAFVTLKQGVTSSIDLKQDLIQQVRTHIGPIATPEYIQWAEGLPKTRSGKIMRRILKKIALNQLDDIGDVSTLAEPLVVEQLIAARAEV